MISEQAGTHFHYERLFTAGRIKEGRSARNLLLYKGQYGNLLASLLSFVVKHSPVWIIPVVTADMINTANNPNSHMHTYRQKLAVTQQNITLFSGTIRENITHGLTGVSEEELIASS